MPDAEMHWDLWEQGLSLTTAEKKPVWWVKFEYLMIITRAGFLLFSFFSQIAHFIGEIIGLVD